ncbi:MAG TPA: HIT domain-containing protein [Pyrinomonadaceae bacterium]|nr:HIT domain-containing protein [Pyrinomonadaceae bacterium]
MASKVRGIIIPAIFFTAGIVFGGYLFADTRPRSILALNKCENRCLKPNELAGVVASVGIQKFSYFIPSVVMETDKTIVIKHPSPEARIHYVIIPKKDIKNIGEASEEDKAYLLDVFAVVSKIVKEQHLEQYRVVTNGPAYQSATYLHFHLMAR